ncbi:MCE family protein [Mycolicibacterium vaccae]|uniref:MCE family protein n=1 Tax=Mycolicibacterium vaccae TaxID=1810 RepID=UPI003CFFC725
MLDRRTRIQLAIFTVVGLIAGGVMVFGYMRIPANVFGLGVYRVYLELPAASGLYASGNVSYRGTNVGRVESVDLDDTGVRAVLTLRSDVPIPADLTAAVHSQSAVGEQYVALTPHSSDGPELRDGDVIPVDRTSVPPDISRLLDDTNAGLQAIPRDDLRTAVDEAYVAIGGLGPEISRVVKGSTALAIDARAELDALTTLIDHSGPILDSQGDSAPAIRQWAAQLSTISGELRAQDGAVRDILRTGGPATAEATELLERFRPTVPVLLANLVSLNRIALTYNAGLEQLLVLLPQGTALAQATGVPNQNTQQDYKGAYLDFNLNLNLPPTCNTGFLPAQQQRPPVMEDYPDRPAGDLYCRTPQDSRWNVRGAKNIPCAAKPGKRAPTAALCESDENYIPLNDGENWKGDPNATLSDQSIPQLPPVATATYDPASGSYLGADGKVYAQNDLARDAEPPTWQSMLVPQG